MTESYDDARASQVRWTIGVRFDTLDAMRAPTSRELSRLFRRALLAAPLAASCHAETTTPTTPEPLPQPSATATATAPASASASAAPVATCTTDPVNVTGCGGGQAKLHGTLETCGIALDAELPAATCAKLCTGFEQAGCRAFKDSDGQISIFCRSAHPCLGRMPSRGGNVACADDDALAEHLGTAMRMEALSVHAFRELEAELARFGAPARLRRACRAAADDERRHARAMGRLMRRRGVRPPRAARARTGGFASLEALALHNEREGVVGETWGALVASHQAVHAADADVRAAMRAIAREETRHAALSLAIAAWARDRLGTRSAAALDAARADAFAALGADGAHRPREGADAILGWPSRDAARRMLGVLAPTLSARTPRR